MPPAAPFLGRQEMEERTGQRGFPLCDSPTPGVNSARSNARLQIRCADSGLPARPSPLSMHIPFRSHARGCVPRRDGRHSLSVLPETWSRLSHSRSRSQAATADCLPSARRRREYRHEGGIPKGRALRRVFCPAFSARAEKGWPSETKTPRKTPIYLFKKSVYPLSASIPIPLIAACTSTGVQIVPPSS